MLTLPAGLDVFPDRVSAEAVLRSVLDALREKELALAVDLLIEADDVPREVRLAQQMLDKRATDLNELKPWWRRNRRAPLPMFAENRTDRGLFVQMAYWSISAEVFAGKWQPVVLFESNDAGSDASYQLPASVFDSIRPYLPVEHIPMIWLKIIGS